MAGAAREGADRVARRRAVPRRGSPAGRRRPAGGIRRARRADAGGARVRFVAPDFPRLRAATRASRCACGCACAPTSPSAASSDARAAELRRRALRARRPRKPGSAACSIERTVALRNAAIAMRLARQRGATLVVGLMLLTLVTLLGLAGASSAHVERLLAQNEAVSRECRVRRQRRHRDGHQRNREQPSILPSYPRLHRSGTLPGSTDRFEVVTAFRGLRSRAAPGAGRAVSPARTSKS